MVRLRAWLGVESGWRRWAFDVGVDMNRDGTEPLGAVGGMVREVREREGYNDSGTLPVRFVLSKSWFVLSGLRWD